MKESVFLCKREELTIRGTEYRPEGEKLPIAIVSHGFMANQDIVRHYAKRIAELGYAAYCFDFCGGCAENGKSDGATTDMSVLTEVKDLLAVIAYAKSLAYTDASNITLMGCSQGGFVSALTAKKLGAEVSNLILFYPALCIPDDARAGKMMFARFDPKNIPDIIKCGPMKLGRCYVSDVIGLNPFEEICGYQGRTLIVHGTRDDIVALRYAKQAYEEYQKNRTGDQLVKLRIIEGGMHGFTKNHDEAAIVELVEFLGGE